MSKIRLDQTAAWFLAFVGSGAVLGAGALLMQGTVGKERKIQKASYLNDEYNGGEASQKSSKKSSDQNNAVEQAELGDKGSAHQTYWSYEGETGPRFWGELSPGFVDCMDGRSQSPINIEKAMADRELRPIKFSYLKTKTSLENNGHTLRADMADDYQGFISYAGKRYDLKNFHFHLPSEHLVAGVPYEMEMHLVHKSRDGDLAVVAVFLQEGKKGHRELGKIWHNLPHRKGMSGVSARVDPMKFLPKNRGYFAYSGSLTTPPCSEGVQWLVLRKPGQLSPKQVDQFNYIFKRNSRPIRPLHQRKIRKNSVR